MKVGIIMSGIRTMISDAGDSKTGPLGKCSNSWIEVSGAAGNRHVRILRPQRGSGYSDVREFDTHWPPELLVRLAELKGEWFLDSYQRFEHPNYIQKQVDTVLGFYGIRLGDAPVLDFGCGFGASTYCMLKRGATRILAADLEKANTDFASAFLEGMGRAQYVAVVNGDVVPTLQRETFEIIWLQAVMEHLLPGERSSYLRSFWEALRPGGWLIITETPNRSWPVEGHTTGGTWWLPWMKPGRVFQRMREVQKYSAYSDEALYRSGVIGSSYREILDCLGRPDNCREASLEVPRYLKYVYSHAAKRSTGRRLAVGILGFAEPVMRKFLRRPISSFMPFLQHLAFQKM